MKMRLYTVSILIIMVGTFLIPLNIPAKKDNQILAISDDMSTDNIESKAMDSKEDLPTKSIAYGGISGIGSHRVTYHYYQAYITNDHDGGLAGAGEWHFHSRFPSDAGYIPNDPPDNSIMFSVNGIGTVSLDDRWKETKWIGSGLWLESDRGAYFVYHYAWEEDGWPFPRVDPTSVSLGYGGPIELQGNYYTNPEYNNIPGHLEVNRWIDSNTRDVNVRHYMKYYIENRAPTADSISPQNPTTFVGTPIALTGAGSDPDGDGLVYEWDLDYDGINFHVDATGKNINPSFMEGTHLVAYRVKDYFYGTYTPASNIEVTLVTANPSDAPFIDQPEDITYVRNSTGKNITWQPYDDNPRDFLVTRTNSTSINDTQIIMGPSVWNNGSITLDIDGYPLDKYYFTCNVFDTDNHISSSTVIVNVIETDRPTIEHSPENITYIEGEVGHNITWNATDENPARYTITRNGKIFEAETWNGSAFITNVDSLTAGTHLFNCTVFDEFGNTASDIVQVVVLDIVSPEISLTSLINGTTHQSGTPINVIIEEKHLDTVFYNWDGSSNQSTNESSFQTLLPVTDSAHVLYVYAYDSSGNWDKKTFVFITDDTPPIISFYSPSDGATYTSNQIDIIFATEDEVENYWYYIFGIDTNNHTWTSVTTRTLDDGTYTINGFANDSTANIAHISVTFTIDTTPTTTPEDTITTTTTTTSSFPSLFTILLFFAALVVVSKRHKKM